MKFFIFFFVIIAVVLAHNEYNSDGSGLHSVKEGEHGLRNGHGGFSQSGHGHGHGQDYNQGDHVGHGQQACGQHGRHGF
ncbi:antifungal protein-like [Drosophila innubila]|uniref:antifungal protein-like n=1 Tax=Drosophila innubila TaxID=198719 RepID=UPI00148B7269|nr:antifungal protein-like [Drosophila innubila]